MPRKIVLVTMVIALLSAPPVFADWGRRGWLDTPPAPRLIYPLGEKVILTDNSSLEFKWWNTDFINVSTYEFRLYKGYRENQENLIIKEVLPRDVNTFQVKPELFVDGQVYTWVMRRAFDDGIKSDKAFNSFRVIKK